MSPYLFVVTVLIVGALPMKVKADRPQCGLKFLSDFKNHYGIFECLSRADKTCLRDHVEKDSSIIGVPIAGGLTATAAKLGAQSLQSSNNRLIQFVAKKAANTATTKAIAWGSVAGLSYWAATKAAGGVLGFLIDNAPAGDDHCASEHPWVLKDKKNGSNSRCEPIYRTTDNRVVANFLALKNESQQLEVLKDGLACDYFFRLHGLLKIQGQQIAEKQGVKELGLFDDSSMQRSPITPEAKAPKEAFQ